MGLGIYGRPANDVAVEHCRFIDNFQAITNWGGSNWRIQHNTITNVITLGLERRDDDGNLIGVGIGGTPIVLGGRDDDGAAATARHNIVSYNKVTGEVLFHPDDDGTEGDIWAIAVIATPGTEFLSGNLITHNQVSLVSSKPDLREVVALVLEDLRVPPLDPVSCDVIYDNIITENDFRGPDYKIQFSPDALSSCNQISRNK